ncbi:MAG: cupin domain-containing protein [Sedimenticolaceae bacterium]
MNGSGNRLRLPRGLDGETFLRDYWQKQPLLMRAALPSQSFTLTPEELAGLACEPELESRLVIEGEGGRWEVRHGPFGEADFTALPESHWTLLVQDVDKYITDMVSLIEAFEVVPDWRIDDIMISYATDQGGVGPHSDAYDVFLMQASGRRRWRISDRHYAESDILPGIDQRILARFHTAQEWVLEPGDVLYLPPGVAHWGTAEGPCMTYSLGFRAPSQQELASDWFQHLVSLSGETRLDDPDDLRADSRAQLTAGVFRRAAQLLNELPDTHSEDFRRWLGRYLTEPKAQFEIPPRDPAWQRADLADCLRQGQTLRRHPFAHIAWTVLNDAQVVLFMQGEDLTLSSLLLPMVRQIAERRLLEAEEIAPVIAATPEAGTLLLRVVNDGIFEVDEE